MEYLDTEEKLISEFNEAKWQIFRLNNLWNECRHLRERGDLIGVRWKLDSAAVELWNDAIRLDKDKKDDKEKYGRRITDLETEIEKAVKEKKHGILYQKLIEKEKILREIQEAAGKGAKLKSADDDYM